MLDRLRNGRKISVPAIKPDRSPGKHLFVESVGRFVQACPDLAGKRVLLCGDNVTVFVMALQARGAKVDVAVGLEQAKERVQRRFPGLNVSVRDKQFMQSGARGGTYDMIIIWDGVGRVLDQWLEGARLLSDTIWADSVTEGWMRVKLPLETADFFPDAWVDRFRKLDFAQVTDPLLVHVHVPKNGGSSTNDLLFESFGYRYVSLYVDDPYINQTDDFLQQRLPQRPHAQVISSHNFRSFPDKVGNRPMLYFTFLRHSLARHLSYFRYARKHYHTFPPEHQKSLPPNFLEMTPQEFLRFEEKVFDHGYGYDQLHHFSPTRDLAAARETLGRFFMVGVVEQLERGLALLRKKLRCLDLHLLDLPTPQANTTADLYRETEGLLNDPETREAMSYLKDDLELYNWALARFERECLMYGV